MIGLDTAAFSANYAQARTQFLDAAQDAGLSVEQHLHPFRGPAGEDLAMDVARDGPADAKAVLVVTSACHGVEGFAGSAVQVACLRDAGLRGYARAREVAVVYVHALNPWGFAHLRRVTHEGVDLNRNFVDFSHKLPVNDGYRQLHPLLLPAQWPPTRENEQALKDWIASHGLAAFQAAVTQGQYECPDGLFYGGTAPTWSHRNWRRVLRQHAHTARRLAWIDVHTGLGPTGVGERILAGRAEPQVLHRARAWWQTPWSPLTVTQDGTSSSAALHGELWEAVYEECAHAEYTGITLEYGTAPLAEMLDALRGDHWLALHPHTGVAEADAIRQRMLDAFYVNTALWRTQVLEQANEALFQAVDGLNR